MNEKNITFLSIFAQFYYNTKNLLSLNTCNMKNRWNKDKEKIFVYIVKVHLFRFTFLFSLNIYANVQILINSCGPRCD